MGSREMEQALEKQMGSTKILPFCKNKIGIREYLYVSGSDRLEKEKWMMQKRRVMDRTWKERSLDAEYKWKSWSQIRVETLLICAEEKLDYVIPGAGRLLELTMEICSNPDCIYLVHKTYSKSII